LVVLLKLYLNIALDPFGCYVSSGLK
jgi:hypothetical protein